MELLKLGATMRHLSLVLAVATVLAAAACMSTTSPDAGRRLTAHDDTTGIQCSGWIDTNGVCHDNP
jgi:hypothetical protein